MKRRLLISPTSRTKLGAEYVSVKTYCMYFGKYDSKYDCFRFVNDHKQEAVWHSDQVISL